MKISIELIRFRIDIDFDGCDVDMVLNEMTAKGISFVPPILKGNTPYNVGKIDKTPTDESVEKCLEMFLDSEVEELEKIGVNVFETYGLMQGCCHLMCECDISIFSKELITQSEKIVTKIFKKYVKYYK